MKKELSDKKICRKITDYMKNEICYLKQYYNMTSAEIIHQVGVPERIVGEICREKFNNIAMNESDYYYHRSDIEMVEWIQHLNKFYSVKDIVKLTGLDDKFVTKYLYDDNINQISENIPITGYDITVERLIKFKNVECHIGDKYKINVGGGYTSNEAYFGNRSMIEVTVKKKYPFIVQTDKGCFQYFDLFTGSKID